MAYTTATITTTTDLAARLRAGLSRLFTALGAAIDAYGEARSRRDQIEALERLSDAQLTAMGIRRDMIVHHVFRDRIGF